MAGNQILIAPGPARRRLTGWVLGMAAAGVVLMAGLLGLGVIPRAAFTGAPAQPPRSEAMERQRQMSHLPQWREIRRQARARALPAADSAKGPPAPAASPPRGRP
ncbi:MAG TPA: hypothetical protein VFJ16_32450 [Longimicrobium sp.]|nr:hypothetical protein [Longimicrobium sp.]